MSDQQDKNTEQSNEEAAASKDPLAKHMQPEPSVKPSEEEKPPAGAVANKAAETKRGGSSAPGWIALLLVIALGAGAAWLWREQQQKEASIASRLQVIENAGNQEVTAADLAKQNTQLQDQLKEALSKIQSELKADVAAAKQQSGSLAQSVGSLQSQLSKQQSELAQYSAHDRESWQLAEVQYLLRLANQRLVMGKDAVAAQALLKSADAILLELDDVRLHEVRAALASDLAAVRAVPKVDVEGTYLRLSALIEQAGKLVIFELPEQAAKAAPENSDDWRARLRQGWAAAIAKLSDYIIIRRRDVPMQALMDPQWEGMVRQNLRMLFEQAQVSLLSGNETLYRESLQRAQHWVKEFFESDESAARAMAAEITELEDVDVAVELPDISNSVQALDAVMKERLQSGGTE